MKPLMLHGHERSITQIKYNREGDLLFSSAKDPTPNVWYTVNGERLGTFKGHQGAVWAIDVNWESTKVLTASADNTSRLWDLQTGTQLHEMPTRSAARTCGFSYSGHMFLYSTDEAMGQSSKLFVYDARDEYQMSNAEPFLCIPMDKSKITAAQWGPLDEYIITGHENGELCQWDIKSGELITFATEHNKDITDLQLSHDQTMFISSSKDHLAKLFDTSTMEPKKTYKTERPVNSAAISPTRPHVLLGGGQEARDVTMSSVRSGKFDARFYHLIFEEEFGRVKGHFGPINSVQFHPDGKSFSSGGEDGYIRMHQFDQTYLDFEFEY